VVYPVVVVCSYVDCVSVYVKIFSGHLETQICVVGHFSFPTTEALVALSKLK